MILPDANLLIYTRNAEGARHPLAVNWWESCLNGQERIGLPWAVIVTYLRVCSMSSLFTSPAAIGALLDEVDEWLERPHVEVIEPTSHHLQAVRSIAEPLNLGGNLMSDVHLAALAIEYGAVVHTADRDFARFKGVRWHNPLQ